MVLVRPEIACLDMVYAVEFGRGVYADTEPLFMILCVRSLLGGGKAGLPPALGRLSLHDPDRCLTAQVRREDVDVKQLFRIFERDLVHWLLGDIDPGVLSVSCRLFPGEISLTLKSRSKRPDINVNSNSTNCTHRSPP